MAAYPNMVAGPGRWDTVLMRLSEGKIISKGGAEGYQMMGILPGAIRPGSPGIGIAYKISDGDGSGRARSMLGIAILRALGFGAIVDAPEFAELNKPTLRNWRGLEIGEIRPAQAMRSGCERRWLNKLSKEQKEHQARLRKVARLAEFYGEQIWENATAVDELVCTYLRRIPMISTATSL